MKTEAQPHQSPVGVMFIKKVFTQGFCLLFLFVFGNVSSLMPYSPSSLKKTNKKKLGKNKMRNFKMFQTSASLISHCMPCFKKNKCIEGYRLCVTPPYILDLVG